MVEAADGPADPVWVAAEPAENWFPEADLEDYARSICNLHKICLRVLAANAPAVRLYERCGFETAGVLREHFYHQDAYHDVAIMEKRIGRGR